MATTAPGSPYVESSDLVANYPAVSEALAERVDTVGVLPFATSTARGTAIPSPTEGQYTYLQDTNATEYWDGSAWVAAGVAPGLVHINTTTFSAVSSVSLDNVFTSDYANYKIIINVTGVGAGAPNIPMRLRASGTDDSTANYSYGTLQMDTAAGSPANIGASSQTSLAVFVVDSNLFEMSMDFINPQLSTPTFINFAGMISTGGLYVRLGTAKHNVSLAFDGLSFNASSSNITGTIRTYGYKNGA